MGTLIIIADSIPLVEKNKKIYPESKMTGLIPINFYTIQFNNYTYFIRMYVYPLFSQFCLIEILITFGFHLYVAVMVEIVRV